MNRQEYHAIRRLRHAVIQHIGSSNSIGYTPQTAQRSMDYAEELRRQIQPRRNRAIAETNMRWQRLHWRLADAVADKQRRERDARELAQLRKTGSEFRDAFLRMAVVWGGKTAAELQA